jgi:Skp family chaperone for outer membrane proteins
LIPKTKQEAAKQSAFRADYLLQYVDKDYRAALKAVRDLSESKARTERSIKDISEATEKAAAEKRLKDFQSKLTESDKAAAQKRKVLLRRLVEEIGDVWTLKLQKTYP